MKYAIAGVAAAAILASCATAQAQRIQVTEPTYDACMMACLIAGLAPGEAKKEWYDRLEFCHSVCRTFPPSSDAGR